MLLTDKQTNKQTPPKTYLLSEEVNITAHLYGMCVVTVVIQEPACMHVWRGKFIVTLNIYQVLFLFILPYEHPHHPWTVIYHPAKFHVRPFTTI